MWLSYLSHSDIGVLTECGYMMFISLRHRLRTPMSEGDKHDIATFGKDTYV
jgi:hypothetical protein